MSQTSHQSEFIVTVELWYLNIEIRLRNKQLFKLAFKWIFKISSMGSARKWSGRSASDFFIQVFKQTEAQYPHLQYYQYLYCYTMSVSTLRFPVSENFFTRLIVWQLFILARNYSPTRNHFKFILSLCWRL